MLKLANPKDMARVLKLQAEMDARDYSVYANGNEVRAADAAYIQATISGKR
jgi:hypothetical protein